MRTRAVSLLPDGSHVSMWDDQQVFMDGVIKFSGDVDENKF